MTDKQNVSVVFPYAEILSAEKPFRMKQIHKAWFDPKISSFEQITTLPVNLREKLKDEPWLSVNPLEIVASPDGSEKAILALKDGLSVETVLLRRKSRDGGEKRRNTVCLSSQVGCALNCLFCATGKLGFKRNLAFEEIIDQFRFWQKKLFEEGIGEEINNVVFMGQGEPLLNYEAVKRASSLFVDVALVGPRKITISTAGIKSEMEKILTDKEFPPVRIAISLHSAIEETRKYLMPSHTGGFLEYLPEWADRYHKVFTGRALFLSLEYILLSGVNDDEKHLKALIGLARKMGRVRVNLIQLNHFKGLDLVGSSMEKAKNWQTELNDRGIVCTIRQSGGEDIAAACGQLAAKRAEEI